MRPVDEDVTIVVDPDVTIEGQEWYSFGVAFAASAVATGRGVAVAELDWTGFAGFLTVESSGVASAVFFVKH